MTTATDIVVVGAGFAGLTASIELERLGYEVVVVEARDGIGGKVESQVDALGRRVDTGGQFVSDDMPNVLALIGHHGRHLARVDHDRSGRGFVGGAAITIDPIAVWQTFERAEAAYSTIWDLEDPLPSGVTSLGAYFAAAGLSDMELQAARSALNGVMCIDIDQLPLEHVVDLARRTPLTRDELQYVVAETMHSVAEQMAGELRQPVRVRSAARTIDVRLTSGETSVVVTTARDSIEARHVVIAVPPTAYRSMTFTPPLSIKTVTAASAFRAGSVMKFLVRYDRPFWRRAEIGASSVWIDPEGLYVGDASPDDDAPMLVAFLGGPASEVWRTLTPATRREALLDRLVEAYGPQASTPTSFVERDWADDEWGAGGYWNVLLDPGAHDAVATLLRGAPGITFASTELSPSFPGYVEGAITAGRAAAAAVANAVRVC